MRLRGASRLVLRSPAPHRLAGQGRIGRAEQSAFYHQRMSQNVAREIAVDEERMTYEQFLRAKKPIAPSFGIPVQAEDIPSSLFDFQRHCAEFALEKGRAGIYLDTGLGKSAIELAFADRASRYMRQPALILTPLAVAEQMHREAEKFGLQAKVIREASQVSDGINICNYDRLGKLDASAFGAVVLDEASVLKSFTGKTTRALMEAFAGHRFRLNATATPAPNDHMELGQQAQFLGVMDSNEMLMRWFIADQTEMGRYRLKAHGERDFWDWMAGWTRMAENPEDIGYDGSRFKLPQLRLIYHEAASQVTPPLGALFAQASSATEIHDIKRQTATARAELVGCLLSAEPAVIWCDTNYEADALRKVIPEAIEVRGSQPIEKKEELLEAFAIGEAKHIISKPSICGWGLNWQHCHRMIFVGRSFSYESYYQAVRRCWRFGQTQPVEVHILLAEGEMQTAAVIDRKGLDHARMKASMCAAMKRAMGRADELREYQPNHEGRLPTWLSAA
jgi:hypothetical protein